jgi:signal transduction histidine kinase
MTPSLDLHRRDRHRRHSRAAPRSPSRPATLEEQERFAAYVAHELRTPLATQRALLELALGDPDTDEVAWREIGEDVLQACRQQERLLEACLMLARSRRSRRRYEPADLAGIAADALQAHEPCEHETVLALQPAWTTGDPDQLAQLAANLISNAARHNLAAGRIEIATRTEARHAVLSVANTGPVIPAQQLPRLFQPFERLDPNPATASDGIGLGLTIVREIADAHGATLTARARPKGGLHIELRFPTLHEPALARARGLGTERNRPCLARLPRAALTGSA